MLRCPRLFKTFCAAVINNWRADKEGLICSGSPVTPYLGRRYIDVSFKVWAFFYHLIPSEWWPLNHPRAESQGLLGMHNVWFLDHVCVYSSLMCMSVWPDGHLGFYVRCMQNEGLRMRLIIPPSLNVRSNNSFITSHPHLKQSFFCTPTDCTQGQNMYLEMWIKQLKKKTLWILVSMRCGDYITEKYIIGNYYVIKKNVLIEIKWTSTEK